MVVMNEGEKDGKAQVRTEKKKRVFRLFKRKED